MKAQLEEAAEEARVAKIEKVCGEDHDAIKAKAIAEKWDAERTELEVLRAERPAAPNVITGSQDADPVRTLEAAVAMSAGLPMEDVKDKDDRRLMAGLETEYGDQTLSAAEKLRGIGLQRLFELTCAQEGKSVPTVFGEDSIRAAFSTVSLPGILANTAYKSLLDSFFAIDGVSLRCAEITSVKNFLQVTRYRMTMTGDLQLVSPAGEIQDVSLDEESYTAQAHTYAGLISLTREMIINDDLGAFLQIPRLFGRKAAIAREKAFWTLVLANTGDFFNASATPAAQGHNPNKLEGAAYALSIAGLTKTEQLFRDQVDKEGEPVMVEPAILLVPTALAVTAQQLMTETRVNETTTAKAPKPANNPHAGKWRAESTPWLNSQSLTNQSSTGYYLLADPADVGAFVISFLNGKQTPTIERGTPDFDRLGMQMRCVYDFGVDQGDPRGGVWTTGVAAST